MLVISHATSDETPLNPDKLQAVTDVYAAMFDDLPLVPATTTPDPGTPGLGAVNAWRPEDGESSQDLIRGFLARVGRKPDPTPPTGPDQPGPMTP